MRYLRGVARAAVPARSALVGNPSDGFGGATIAFTLDDLEAVVQAEPALEVELVADPEPQALLRAALRQFVVRRPETADRGVRLTLVSSSSPPGVGRAGSSAIVIAALRALGELFGDAVPLRELPQLALACETEELGITAGLQDRVVQAYGGLVFMDFDPALLGGGRFEPLDEDLLPPLFVAWLPDARTDSGAAHREAHDRFDAGDPQIVAGMAAIAALTKRALSSLTIRDSAGLGVLLDENFDLRRRLYDLDPRHVELVDTARRLGAPANYTGSGGAIVGLFRDEDHLAELRAGLEALGCELLVRRA